MMKDTHHLPKSSNPKTTKLKDIFFLPLHQLICSAENKIQKQTLHCWGETLFFS